jgi:hypothetical protein
MPMRAIENLFLSIGSIKSGTSWLYMLLRNHPQIDTVPVKEIHYFAHFHTEYQLLCFPNRLKQLQDTAAWLSADRPEEARAILSWFTSYLADPVNDAWLAGLYRDPHGANWCSEFSNLNALLPQAGWQHVRNSAGRIRVIYTMRNPLSRLWSHVRFHMALTGLLAQCDDWTESNFTTFLAVPEISRLARYTHVLRLLEQSMDPKEYRLLIYEDIETAPDRVLADIEALLEICPGAYDPPSLTKRHNPGSQHTMPPAFVAASTSMVESELESLEAHGFAIPAAWGHPRGSQLR